MTIPGTTTGKFLVDYIINSGTDGVWFSDFKAATGADADVRKLIPLGWVDVDECGEFWTCLGRCLKKMPDSAKQIR